MDPTTETEDEIKGQFFVISPSQVRGYGYGYRSSVGHLPSAENTPLARFGGFGVFGHKQGGIAHRGVSGRVSHVQGEWKLQLQPLSYLTVRLR